MALLVAVAPAGWAEEIPDARGIDAALPVPAPPELKRPESRELGGPARPKSYWLPALEITGWNTFQNRWSFYAGDREVYDISPSSWKRNVGSWWWDKDAFATNQIAHPYMGSLYFGLARSSGLSFTESFGYAFGGSLMWELLGETEPPAFDDQITTSWGGGVIGEILFRLSNRLLDGGAARPGFWRELGAMLLNPAQGLNRRIYGNGFRPTGIDAQPFYAELRATLGTAEAREWDLFRGPGPVVSASVHVVNGVPGSDWRFRRPFDHFDATFGIFLNTDTLQSPSFTTMMLRGAVIAAQYGSGTSSGLWGLYVNFDYVSPAVYRASSSSVGLGTTGQVDWGSWAFQGHALVGGGFGAGGSSAAVGARDYHFGGQAVAQLEGALFYRDRIRLRTTTRAYFTSGELTDQHEASEDIEYTITGLDWRIAGLNAVGVETISARRRATYPGAPDADFRVDSLLVVYERVSDPGMGRGR